MTDTRGLSRALPCLLALGLALPNAFACKGGPAPVDAFSGQPLRTEARADGLGIDVMREGSGRETIAGDTVTIHYRSATADGQTVGSADGRALTFVVGKDPNLVDGLQLGVESMKVNELRRITVPPRLGYRGRADMGFPPDADLVFSVELMRQAPPP